MTERVLLIPGELAEAIRHAAARAYPHECCGLLEGVDTAKGWCVLAVHETANVAPDPARHFHIDEEMQFVLLRALRETGKRLVGCFHSHPGGKAAPSATDQAGAGETDFVWLIAGGDPENGFTLAAYAFAGEEAGFVPATLHVQTPFGFA